LIERGADRLYPGAFNTGLPAGVMPGQNHHR
jgi:hypothetical protein